MLEFLKAKALGAKPLSILSMVVSTAFYWIGLKGIVEANWGIIL